MQRRSPQAARRAYDEYYDDEDDVIAGGGSGYARQEIDVDYAFAQEDYSPRHAAQMMGSAHASRAHAVGGRNDIAMTSASRRQYSPQAQAHVHHPGQPRGRAPPSSPPHSRNMEHDTIAI